MMSWDMAQDFALSPFSHRSSFCGSQVAGAVPELHAPCPSKSLRRWRPAVLENVSLTGLVHVAVSDLVIVVRERPGQVGMMCPPVQVGTG